MLSEAHIMGWEFYFGMAYGVLLWHLIRWNIRFWTDQL